MAFRSGGRRPAWHSYGNVPVRLFSEWLEGPLLDLDRRRDDLQQALAAARQAQMVPRHAREVVEQRAEAVCRQAVVVCQFYVQLDIGGIERNCCEAASFRFGHGKENLASVLLVFNLLALAVHAARKITEFKPI